VTLRFQLFSSAERVRAPKRRAVQEEKISWLHSGQVHDASQIHTVAGQTVEYTAVPGDASGSPPACFDDWRSCPLSPPPSPQPPAPPPTTFPSRPRLPPPSPTAPRPPDPPAAWITSWRAATGSDRSPPTATCRLLAHTVPAMCPPSCRQPATFRPPPANRPPSIHLPDDNDQPTFDLPTAFNEPPAFGFPAATSPPPTSSPPPTRPPSPLQRLPPRRPPQRGHDQSAGRLCLSYHHEHIAAQPPAPDQPTGRGCCSAPDREATHRWEGLAQTGAPEVSPNGHSGGRTADLLWPGEIGSQIRLGFSRVLFPVPLHRWYLF